MSLPWLGLFCLPASHNAPRHWNYKLVYSLLCRDTCALSTLISKALVTLRLVTDCLRSHYNHLNQTLEPAITTNLLATKTTVADLLPTKAIVADLLNCEQSNGHRGFLCSSCNLFFVTKMAARKSAPTENHFVTTLLTAL